MFMAAVNTAKKPRLAGTSLFGSLCREEASSCQAWIIFLLKERKMSVRPNFSIFCENLDFHFN
jgi:hypothetical protein